MAREYIIYTDESIKSGPFYGNFYGGALLRSADFDDVNALLREIATASGLTGEIKWQKVTAQYLSKYLILMDAFFDLVRDNRVKVRVMLHDRYTGRPDRPVQAPLPALVVRVERDAN